MDYCIIKYKVGYDHLNIIYMKMMITIKPIRVIGLAKKRMLITLLPGIRKLSSLAMIKNI